MKRNILFSLVFLLGIPVTNFFAQCDENAAITYLSDNLFINSSFESGNQYINSDQTYHGDCMNNANIQEPEFYSLPYSGSSPSACNSYWTPNLYAHDGDRFMISDFPVTREGVNLWCQKIITQPNSDYEFSGYFANVLNELYDDIDPIIRINVEGNDSNLGVIYENPLVQSL